jgi:hypothetical protein
MTGEKASSGSSDPSRASHLARFVLVAFLLTFVCARCIVFLIMSRTIPDLYMHVKGTHVHHLNYGIFLLSGLGGYLLFQHPLGRKREIAAVLYGIAMGLTFDEFGMWIHLGGSYWQRASWDAITVVGGGLALIAYAPAIRRFRPRHWLTGIALGCVIIAFFILLHRSFAYAGKVLEPKIHKVESTAPS